MCWRGRRHLPGYHSSIAACEVVLEETEGRLAEEMAQMMITAQEKEIADFKAWHDKNTDKM